jgi:large conductance mechanosensitive channel
MSYMGKKDKGEIKIIRPIQGFAEFIKEQGVVGLSIGFIFGASISSLTDSLVNDIITPLLSLLTGNIDDIAKASWKIGESEIMWGSFVTTLLEFILIAAVVYFVFKGMHLEKLKIKKPKVGK